MEKFNFKKKYGQNFLNNENILNEISSAISVVDMSKILEIGPGAGALTKKLIKFNKDVIAFEIDTGLKQYLDNICSEKLHIVYEDFLNINLSDYLTKSEKFCVIANIPYYITTPIINKFIDEGIFADAMVLLMQKEVAERLCSKEHTSYYGAITVLLNYFFEISYVMDVNRDQFYPVPNVDSAVIKLEKRCEKMKVSNYNKFKTLVYDAFKRKRKNLKNNLKNYDLTIIESILNKYSLKLTDRAEDLSCDIFIEIVNNL